MKAPAKAVSRRRALLVVILVALGLVFGGGSADALPGDCKGNAPTPLLTGGMMSVAPEHPSGGDPFKEGSTVRFADVYDTSRLQFFHYDNGCGVASGMMPGTGASVGTIFGLQIPGLLLNWTSALLNRSMDASWLQPLDQPLADLSHAINTTFWGPWSVVALLLVSVLMLWRSRTGDTPRVITAGIWAITVFVASTWLLSYPTEATNMVDTGVQTASAGISTAFADHPAAADPNASAQDVVGANMDSLNRLQYETWLAGVFGNANSTTAKKFGPDVFRATHLTYDETATYNSDPSGAGKRIFDEKKRAFKSLASKVQDADPAAYTHFTGNDWGGTISVALLNLVMVVAVIAFPLMAAVGVLAAFLLVRFAVPMAPVGGVLFMLENFRELCMAYMRRAAPIIVMGPVYLLATLLVLRFDAAIRAASMSLWAQVVLMIACSFVAWRLTKPGNVIPRPRAGTLIRPLAMMSMLRVTQSTNQTTAQPATTGAASDPAFARGIVTAAPEPTATFVPDAARQPAAIGGGWTAPTRTYGGELAPSVVGSATDGAAGQPALGASPSEAAVSAVWLPSSRPEEYESSLDLREDGQRRSLPPSVGRQVQDPALAPPERRSGSVALPGRDGPWSDPVEETSADRATAAAVPALGVAGAVAGSVAGGDPVVRPGETAAPPAAGTAPGVTPDSSRRRRRVRRAPAAQQPAASAPSGAGTTRPGRITAAAGSGGVNGVEAAAAGAAGALGSAPSGVAGSSPVQPPVPTVPAVADAAPASASAPVTYGPRPDPGRHLAAADADRDLLEPVDLVEGEVVADDSPAASAPIAEANSVLDEWGRPVFIVYSPAGNTTVDLGKDG